MASFLNKATSAFQSKDEDKTKKQEEEGESLTTILETEQQRSALTILIADITKIMRKQIVDAFDPRETGKQEDLFASLKDEEGNPIDLDKLSDEDRKAQIQKLVEKQKKDYSKREKEVTDGEMVGIKTSALKNFDEWRDAVIQRVGEIVNSRSTAQKQQDRAKPKTQRPSKTEQIKGEELSLYKKEVDKKLQELYPPVRSELRQLEQEKRATVLHSVLLLLLSLEHYHAQSRTLLLHLTTSLGLPTTLLGQDEERIARGLLAAAANMTAEEETKAKAEQNSSNRKWKVGLAGAAGAVLIGVTGGLAAPLLAAGIGSVMGGLGLGASAAAGYLGTLAGSGVLVGSLFGAYGGRMTSKMMDEYAREVEDFAFVPVRSQHKPRKIEKEFRRLRVAIAVSGWLSDKDDVVRPWKTIDIGIEAFALRFELEKLMNLGNALTTMVSSAAWGYAKTEIIKHTVFSALTAGLWPLALLKASKIIDNPWSVANNRAQKAGEVLADALINKAQGERPVTLIGYSLGAKVIYVCLQELAARGAFGLVENVVFMGAPTPSDSAGWRKIRTVVSGRVVNIYSGKDYILGYLYRTSSIQLGVAGLQPVTDVKGIENVDIADIVEGHTLYRHATGPVLERINFEDLDLDEVHRELEALKKQEMEEKEKQDEATANVKDSGNKEADDKEGGKDVSDDEVKKMEEEVDQKNQSSYMDWMTEKMKLAGESTSSAYSKARDATTARRSGQGAASSDSDKTGAGADAEHSKAPAPA